MRTLAVTATLIFPLGLALAFAPRAAPADTLADCGRFFLKFNAETKQMACVGGKRKRQQRGASASSIAQDLQRSLRSLQGIVNQAEQLLKGEDLTQAVEQRVRALLNEARDRTREVQQKGRELAQAQRTRTQELASEQRQVTQAQVQLARELEQRQQALTQQLLAEQRSRTQELQRRPATGQ